VSIRNLYLSDKLAESGHGPHLFRIVICVVLVIVLCYCLYAVSLCCSVFIMLFCYCVALLLFVLSYVLIVCTVPLPPGVNPIAVDKYIYLFRRTQENQMSIHSTAKIILYVFRYEYLRIASAFCTGISVSRINFNMSTSHHKHNKQNLHGCKVINYI